MVSGLLTLYSSDVVDLDPEWEASHDASLRCPGCNSFLDDGYSKPINAIAVTSMPAVMATTGSFGIMHRRLWGIIEPFAKYLVAGTVRLGSKSVPERDYVTLYGVQRYCIQDQRGRYSRHRQCDLCERFVSCNGWAHPVVLRRTLGDGDIFHGDAIHIYVTNQFVTMSQLRIHFPKLKLCPVPVVDEPADGQVFPGESGWTGSFKPRRLPKPPTHKPERSIGLWL